MLKVKNQAMGLYEGIEAERVSFREKEKEYDDCLNKMAVELEVKSTSELRLMDDNEVLRVWGESRSTD